MTRKELCLETAKRYVQEGRALLARQRNTVERLRAAGMPSGRAEARLWELVKAQPRHEENLTSIEVKTKSGTG
jgi:hypothetical protein